jgi:cholesterol oxidase
MVAMMQPSGETVRRFLTGPVSHLARLQLFYAEIARLANDQQAMAERLPAHTMIFLGMGQDASDGRVVLRKRFGRRPKLAIQWDNARTLPLIDRMQAEFRRIAAELGGEYVPGPTWRYLRRLITVHPLGGCGLADDASQGVLNPFGEVWNYPGLYVADGSSVPRALGPNPALTISAVAERTAEHIVNA